VRVFVTHNPEDLAAYYGRALPELRAVSEVVLNPTDHDLTTDELIAAAGECQVIVAHRAMAGEAEVFERLGELLAFLRCAVDISTIDVAAASRHGVLVARAAKSFIASTAELALGLFLDTARHIADSTVDYRADLDPPQRSGRQLRGQTAGIIGCGAIGSYLAAVLVSLGLRVLVYDPYRSDLPATVEPVGLDVLLANSDVVFPLAPGEVATTKLIGAPELAAMKRGATLINVSRGEVLDEAAVGTALDSGQLGALGIDVGLASDQRPSALLAGRPDVVATPHLGGLTPESADAQAASSVEQVRAILEGSMPPRSVNPEQAFRLTEFWAR
jgi:D-3-phosphoglycerate dehydrogenase